MRPATLALLLALAGCDATLTAPPPPPPPLEACAGLPPLTAAVVPATVRVNGAATVSAAGGSGRYRFTLASTPSGGALSGTRYVAGLTAGVDVVEVTDDCGQSARVSVTVQAPFTVVPTRAAVAPGRSFVVTASGVRGAARFSAQALPSGGTLAPQSATTARYTAGSLRGTDVLLVQDTATAEQVAVQVTVDPQAFFHAATPRLALPTGTFARLETVDGTGVVTWSLDGGAGALERDQGGWRFVAPPRPTDGGAAPAATVLLTAEDEVLHETTTVAVRLLTELERPGARPQGRRSDVASLVTGDFDGDGEEDLALGVPESDLGRPQGGAVFIYRGGRAGLPARPDWIIHGPSDTAQLGAVMAAGDLDGDGRDDLAIAAPGDDVTVSDSGAVYLYTLGPDGPRLLRPALTGLGRGSFGASLAIADVDGDGDGDLLVGAPGADLAPGSGFSARGVVDVFLLQAGAPIADLGELRLSGVDLAADGLTRRASNLRAGRALVAGHLNGDDLVDLAFLTSVNNTLLPDGGAQARTVAAVQVHFGRRTATRFEEVPDLYVLPANVADTDEGTWRLGLIPAGEGRPPLLVAAADRLDAPDLRAGDAGTAGGANAGGALLFDLSAVPFTATPAERPTQVGRLAAWARLYGDQANIQAGRAFAAADVTGDGATELVLGAPYAARVDPLPDGGAGTVTTPLTGRLALYRLTAGAVVNRPEALRAGLQRADVLGTGLVPWRGGLAALAGRATTPLGDFTGRLDAFTGGMPPAAWGVSSSDVPAQLGGQGFGAGLEVSAFDGGLRAVLGVPGYSSPGGDRSGNEVGAGQALLYAAGAPASPRVLAEGAATAWLTDGGWRAAGGRTLAADLAMTDFDGDGLQDVAIAAPTFSPPRRLADGGLSSSDYAVDHPACAPATSQSPGGVLVQLGRGDGTFREAFHLWAPRELPGCVVPDGGQASSCQRALLARNGLVGGFDFDGDGRQDLLATRTNGFELFTGRAPDDAQLAKATMGCDPLYTSPVMAQPTSAPAALGDLDGDGCDEVSVRYSDNANRQGLVILFGFDPGGVRCAGRTTAAWVRLSGDTETGVATMRLGVAATRAGRVVRGDLADYVAITADLYPWPGEAQPAVLLVDAAALAAKRPAAGEALVSILNDGLTPLPLLPPHRALGFGRALAGGADVTGDGVPDLVVSATGATLNGDGTGAVYLFAGGTLHAGPNVPWLTVAPDHRERASFGQDVSVSRAAGGVPAMLGIAAPTSYRAGTAQGTAFLLPLDF